QISLACEIAIPLQSLDHSACPSLALTPKRFHAGWGLFEAHSCRLVSDAVAFREKFPRQHDVFANHLRPSLTLSQCGRAKCAERTLSDKRSLIKRLLPLCGRNSNEVIPFLKPCDETRPRVSNEDAARDCARLHRVRDHARHDTL